MIVGFLEIEEKVALKMETFTGFELKFELIIRNETELHRKEPSSDGNTVELVVCVFIMLQTGK